MGKSAKIRHRRRYRGERSGQRAEMLRLRVQRLNEDPPEGAAQRRQRLAGKDAMTRFMNRVEGQAKRGTKDALAKAFS